MYKQHTSKFIENKYSTWYFAIIDRALSENRVKGAQYFERHHVLPKAKISMVYALKRLATGAKYGARWYAKIRAEFMRTNSGPSHPSFGRKASPEECARRSAAAPKTKSAEHRRKIGDANARRIWTEESRRRSSVSASQKSLSAEHRANIAKRTAGDLNPMVGTKWIHHLRDFSLWVVKKHDLDQWISTGWVIGQSAKTVASNRQVQAERRLARLTSQR